MAMSIGQRWVSGGRYRKVGYYKRYNNPGGSGNELKYWDFTTDIGGSSEPQNFITGTAGSNGPIFVNGAGASNKSLVLIPGGSTQNFRIGQKVSLKSVHLKIDCNMTGFSAAALPVTTRTTNNVYFIIVIDHQCNGTVPTFEEVFQDPTDSTGTLAQRLQNWFRRLDRSSRYTILKIKKIRLVRPGTSVIHTVAGPATTHYMQGPTTNWKWNKKLNGLVIEYQDSINTAGPPVSYPLSKVCCNNLIMFAVADQTLDTTSQVTCKVNGRIRFIG